MATDDSSSEQTPGAWQRPAARATALEDITRAFLADAHRNPKAAAAFSDIASALIPRVSLAAAVAVARLVAGREDIPAPVLAALAERGLKPRGARADQTFSTTDSDDAERNVKPVADEKPAAAETSIPPDFIAADAATRERMIADASRFGALDSGPELRRRPDAVATLALERAAFRNDRDDVLAILARFLAIPAASLAPLIEEATGDAFAILLKAAAIDEDRAIPLFVGVGPAATRAGAGLRAAMERLRSVDRPAAIRLVAAMTRQDWAPRINLDAGFGGTSREPRSAAATSATISPSFTRERDEAARRSRMLRQ